MLRAVRYRERRWNMMDKTRRSMRGNASVCLLVGVAALCVTAPAATPTDAELDRGFTQTVRPFLTTYCVACHSGTQPAAQLDLRAYPNVAAVTADYPHWN